MTAWVRQQPLVGVAGDRGGDGQVSEAYSARWVRELAGGRWAVVDDMFYVVDYDGRRYVEQQTEYLFCIDPTDPGGTEIGADATYQDRYDLDPSDAGVRQAAAESVEPTDEEWAAHGPTWAVA